MKVAVVGLGKLGMPFAAVASKYHDVIGLDIDEEKLTINMVRNNLVFEEPQLNDYLKRYPIEVTSNPEKIKSCELIFLFFNTEHEGEYSAEPILRGIEQLSSHLFHNIIVIKSTLAPSTMDKVVLPQLKEKGLYGSDAPISEIFYNPAEVAIGSAIEEYEKATYTLVGANSYPEKIVEFYEAMNKKIDVIVDNFATIEIIKYALNLACISRIALLSVLTEYCERYNGNIDTVSQVFKKEERVVGAKILKGGLGFGGPCYPLDARAFRKTLIAKNLNTAFLDGIMTMNDIQVKRSLLMIVQQAQTCRMPTKDVTVSILGLTYKPDVPYVMESQAIEISKQLSPYMNVVVYDPMGMKQAEKELDTRVIYAKTLEDAIDCAEIIFIAVPWKDFSYLRKKDFSKDQIVIDPWRMLINKGLECKYIPYGIGNEETNI